MNKDKKEKPLGKATNQKRIQLHFSKEGGVSQ